MIPTLLSPPLTLLSPFGKMILAIALMVWIIFNFIASHGPMVRALWRRYQQHRKTAVPRRPYASSRSCHSPLCTRTHR